MLSVGDDAHIVPLVRPAGGFLLMKIYEGSHAVRRRTMPTSSRLFAPPGDCGGSARRPAEMATADLLKDSKPPLTLRPNLNCEKGTVTADKPPVCPAGGFLLMKIYEIFRAVRRGRCPHRPACVRKALHYKGNHALCTA